MNLPSVPLGTTTFQLWVQVRTTSNVAASPDSAPTYAIYAEGSSSPLLSGSFASSDTNSKTGFRTTASLSITSGNLFASGGRYVVKRQFIISSTTYDDELLYFVVT